MIQLRLMFYLLYVCLHFAHCLPSSPGETVVYSVTQAYNPPESMLLPLNKSIW